ncbi:MAG: GyrI-like domain-containing protein [Anaerolineales bacterium]
MSKIDLKRELKALYKPPKDRFTIIEVPEMNYLMIDGHGDPNTSADYQAAVEALYAVAYAVKFALKDDPQTEDYVVPPLEGLWWVEEMSEFSIEEKGAWDWTMMILQPEWVTAEVVEQALEEAARKKDLPALDKLRFAPYDEGLAAQILYIGPYADEGPTIAALHDFIREQGGELRGKHHEIYLSDPRRTAPEKLKTIIRQPFHKAA